MPGEKDVWELVHPRCALERAEDIEEVRAMIAGDEVEIAVEELLWLLGGCNDFIDAHRIAGELALAEEDVELARGHFGIAFHLGTKAASGLRGTLPYSRPDNQAFLESGKGLIACLLRQKKLEMAHDIVRKMLRLDPSDPLGGKGVGG